MNQLTEQRTPATDRGKPTVAAYAEWSGLTEAEYQAQLGEPLTPQMAGAAFVQLALNGHGADGTAYALAAGGLRALP